jgi:hypothetical protein
MQDNSFTNRASLKRKEEEGIREQKPAYYLPGTR